MNKLTTVTHKEAFTEAVGGIARSNIKRNYNYDTKRNQLLLQWLCTADIE